MSKVPKLILTLGIVLVIGVGSVELTAAQGEPLRRVHIPYFSGDVRWAEAAVFWFGEVTPTHNSADVRAAYTDDQLHLRVAVFDRRIWYDTTPSTSDLTNWDAVSIYLNLDGAEGTAPGLKAYRFVAQFSYWESRQNYQAAYRGTGSGWVQSGLTFTTESVYRGTGGPNKDADNRGWVASFHIPFSSLGLSAPPPEGTIWGMAVIVHDRDDSAGTSIPNQSWPEWMEPNRPASWGELSFGQPDYTPPPAVQTGSVVIRHKLGGAVVTDGAVGGGTTCGDGLDFWTQWGEANYAGQADFNVQNQADVADWPCFSRYYVTFPLNAIPAGKVILSATLTLHQFGNSGGGEWGTPDPSLIQVFTVDESWNEATLTWNNSPLAAENVSAAWVDAFTKFPGWPGVPRTWDVSRAVAEAYNAGRPLRLALYSADTAYHSGKYFVSSDTGDWNAQGRPTLTVVWGEQAATVHKRVWPVAPAGGGRVTYTLSLLGSGRPLTLTDNLPAQVSAPGPIQVSGGPAASYAPGLHRLTWSGSPAAGQPVTITFPVTVQASGPLAVFNTVVLTDGQGFVFTDTAVFVVDAYQMWLPVLLRNS